MAILTNPKGREVAVEDSRLEDLLSKGYTEKKEAPKKAPKEAPKK